eukprot:TRINITY_DN10037_c0_g1_i1.p1 TRINITY_DN10037_c0_g1~~TRINITY_DN10037_c0_g1_i1.p1  ORF type:complete len:142 (-),score=24.36 TRINITY_DN10037_c0_g1_i1:108-470(-)
MGDQKCNTTVKRRRVSVACVSCRKAHVKCDNGRPCTRCTKKGIGHSCRTAESKRRGRKNINKNKITKASSRVSAGAVLIADFMPKILLMQPTDNRVEEDTDVMTIEEASGILVMLSNGVF